MNGFKRTESNLKVENAVYDKTILAGDGWMSELRAGQSLRIIDLGGNQAVDTTFYDLNESADHYGAVATITAQENIYLTTGSILRAESGKPLLEITADLCGRHDTLGGACSAQSNTVRYSRDKLYMHSCRDTFMLELAKKDNGYSKRDLAPNINFFMNVPITPDGDLKFDDGVSAPGLYVEMKAITDVMVLISNCPQLNNPCNAYNPTPVKVVIWND
ncbi:urea carboxylase [Clostridia bacterium]|nr:urea carboxylase [Clostridia bacterium]